MAARVLTIVGPRRAGPPGRRPARAGRRVVGAGAGPAGGHPRAAAPAAESYNLAFLPADTKMVLAIRPGTLLRRRDVPIARRFDPARAACSSTIAVAARGHRPVARVLGTDSTSDEGRPRADAVTPIRVRPAHGEASGLESRPGHKLGRPAIRRRLATTARRTIASNGGGPMLGRLRTRRPDPRRGPGRLAPRTDRGPQCPGARHPWDEAWKKVAKGQVMLALETRWLRRRDRPGPSRAGSQARMLTLETFSPLFEKAKSYAMGINASDRGDRRPRGPVGSERTRSRSPRRFRPC